MSVDSEKKKRLAASMSRAADTLRQMCGLRRSKEVRGGCFEAAPFRLQSAVWTGDDGFLSLNFFVTDADEVVIAGHGRSKQEALVSARKVLANFTQAEIGALILDARTAYRSAIEAQLPAELPRIERQSSIPKRRQRIFDKSHGKCHYCGCSLDISGKWHIEHKMPRALFGGNEDSNLVASCVSCNHKKRDKTDLEFQAEMAQGAA